jgi:hypothetical protein
MPGGLLSMVKFSFKNVSASQQLETVSTTVEEKFCVTATPSNPGF